jgi:hypothetical protein
MIGKNSLILYKFLLYYQARNNFCGNIQSHRYCPLQKSISVDFIGIPIGA